jgi:hypothetical protein
VLARDERGHQGADLSAALGEGGVQAVLDRLEAGTGVGERGEGVKGVRHGGFLGVGGLRVG